MDANKIDMFFVNLNIILRSLYLSHSLWTDLSAMPRLQNRYRRLDRTKFDYFM